MPSTMLLAKKRKRWWHSSGGIIQSRRSITPHREAEAQHREKQFLDIDTALYSAGFLKVLQGGGRKVSSAGFFRDTA